MASGECIGAIGMTEPGAGSDLQGMKTSATPDGDGFVLNGSKTFITNGQHAGVVVLAAKTEPKTGAKRTTLFTLDTSLPGFKRGRKLDKIGLHSAHTSEHRKSTRLNSRQKTASRIPPSARKKTKQN